MNQGCQMVSIQTKIPVWVNFGGPLWENSDIFYDYLEHLRTFGILFNNFFTFYVQLVHLFRFWYHVPRKSGNPGMNHACVCVCLISPSSTNMTIFGQIRQRLRRQKRAVNAGPIQLIGSTFTSDKMKEEQHEITKKLNKDGGLMLCFCSP
jgi:hypothetical protein